ncbi:MAG TPA: hypothetical protein VGM63_22700 [Mucilaginibacter sp.]|jgi:hypothetical protein
MANDINKTISIQVEVNSSIPQQTDDYKAAIESLRASIAGLSKPLTDLSGSIGALNTDIVKFSDTTGKALQKNAEEMNGSVKKGADASSKTLIGSALQTADKIFNISKIFADKQGKLDEATAEKRRKSEIDSAQKTADSVFTVITKGIEQQSDAKSRGIEDQRAAIKNNDKLSDDEKKKKDAALVKQENQIKLKAFKDEQKANIAQAVMNGALAITKTEAQLGPLAGTLALGAIIAQTAAQIATIERQQPPKPLAKGGYFHSDGKGAVLPGYSRTDNTNAFLRSGEAVVVSEAMRDPWARNLVSAINVAYGGRDFSVPAINRGYAVGGIFTDGGNANRYYNQPVNDQKNLANTVAYQMINNFPPVYVDVKDVNNQQNILAQTINRVNL